MNIIQPNIIKMKKYLICTICTFAIGVGSMSAQSTQTTKVATNKVPLVKVEQPTKKAVVVQPIPNQHAISTTKKDNAKQVIVKKQPIQIAEPNKEATQLKK